jgi:hypothetical protein
MVEMVASASRRKSFSKGHAGAVYGGVGLSSALREAVRVCMFRKPRAQAASGGTSVVNYSCKLQAASAHYELRRTVLFRLYQGDEWHVHGKTTRRGWVCALCSIGK